VSGAMVGRTSFKGDLLYSLAVSGLIYPIFGHWIWGPNGWLATMDTPFRDFAGSTVVHTIGGVLALCGAIALRPRLGRKFKRDGGGMPPGHNMTLAALGAVILWFGWYGFNPGSTLSAMDFEGIGRVATNTTLAACAGASSRWRGCTPGRGNGTSASASTGCSPVSSPSPVRVTECHPRERSPSVRSQE
jgi:Amt family ammonium transporter